MIVSLDDFVMILEMIFFMTIELALTPHLGLVLMLDENKLFILAISIDKDKGMMELVSALQLGKSLRKGHQTYIVALVEIKSDQQVNVSAKWLSTWSISRSDASRAP